MISSDRIRAEFKTFSHTTSMKGLPRVAKSEVKTLRWMWFVATILFLCIAGWQCSTLIIDFMDYPNVIDIDEIEMAGNFGPNAEGISVLVCNNDPLYSDPTLTSHLLTLEEYYTMLDQLTSCYHTQECAHDFPEKKNLRLWKEIRSRKGYFQYLGAKDAYLLGHFNNTMIRSCEILYYDGLTIRDADCSNISVVTLYQIPDYFNCYMFETTGFLRENTTEYPIVGISLILYLDANRRGSQNDLKDTWDELRPNDFWKQGMRVSVYPHSESHDIVRKGRDILPGHFTTLQCGLGFRQRLEMPYGKCQKGEETYTYKGRNVKYSLLTCMSRCIEYGILEKCHCHDGNALGILIDQYNSTPYCASMDNGVSKMVSTMQCAGQQRLHLYEDCVKVCPLPCFEDKFEITMSTALWPSSTQIEEFYYSYLNGTNIAYRFPITPPFNFAQDPDEAEYNRSQLLKKIRENFALVQVTLPDDTYFVITDTKKITNTELVGSLGSILNLWAGITVLFLVEIIEVFVKICSESRNRDSDVEMETKNNNQTVTPETQRTRDIYTTEVGHS